MSYEIVRYEPEFKKQVLDLLTKLWSPSLALNTAYFEWKHERNPYLLVPLIYLAMHDGRVVGMRSFFGVQWEAGAPSQKFPGLYADDFLIAPEHRNRGLVSKIMAAALKDLASLEYEYVFNLSAGPVVFLSSLSMGWRSAGSMQPMRWRAWPVTFRSGLHRILGSLPFESRHGATVFVQRFAKRKRSLADIGQDWIKQFSKVVPWISVEDTPRCTAMAQLVERIISHGRIRHVRDREYFDWRFQNPLSRYAFLFWDKPDLEGYLVLQEYTSEYANKEVVNIVDWEATNPVARAELLRAALSCGDNRVLSIWSATLPTETIAMLQANGFKSLEQRKGVAQQCPALLVRPIRNKNRDGDWLLANRPLLDLTNWELRMLYSMHG